jgi:hypothetical protein
MLTEDTLGVIRELQDGWEKAKRADTKKAYDLLVRAAKADLNI